jgi:threonine/homoserine efflux transporter RhtA
MAKPSVGYFGGRVLLALVVLTGVLLRGRTYDEKQWIGLAVLVAGVAGFCVLEYRAYRERKEGPPSLKA